MEFIEKFFNFFYQTLKKEKGLVERKNTWLKEKRPG
jgi:hypothetical protein